MGGCKDRMCTAALAQQETSCTTRGPLLICVKTCFYKDLGAFGPYYGACLVSKDPELWGCGLVRQSYRKRCSTAQLELWGFHYSFA